MTDAVAVAAGNSDTCFLLRTGHVMCTGENQWGELGDGDNTDRAAPVEVLGISTAVGITGSYDHFCARLASGLAKCWGLNNGARLGDGTVTSSTTPVVVRGL